VRNILCILASAVITVIQASFVDDVRNGHTQWVLHQLRDNPRLINVCDSEGKTLQEIAQHYGHTYLYQALSVHHRVSQCTNTEQMTRYSQYRM